MTSPPTKTLRPLPLLVCTLTLLCIGPVRASAKEQILADANCAFKPPDGWHSTLETMPPQPGLLAAFGNMESTCFVVLIVQDRGQVCPPLNDDAIEDIERGIREHGGGARLWGKTLRVAGLPTYERLGNAEAGGKHLSLLARVTPTGEGTYLLDAVRTDGDVSEVSEVRRTMESFRFLHPPGRAKSRAEHLGELAGKFLGIPLLVGIALLIRKLTERRAAPPPPIPPAAG